MTTDNNPLADAGDFMRCACGSSRSWRRGGAEPFARPDGTAADGWCIACHPLPLTIPTGHAVEIFHIPLSDPAQPFATSAEPIVSQTINA
jgi:hypothetical protein